MYRFQIRPLKSLPLKSRPLTTHAVAWSSDAELAVATDDTVHIFLPEYPTPISDGGGGGGEDAAAKDLEKSQFSLSIRATGIFLPLPSVNTQLCAFAGVRLPPPGAEERAERPSSAEGHEVTGSGASLSQVVRVEWSPGGLGANRRPVLTIMTTNGELLTLGEYVDPRSTAASGLRARSTKMWKVLWGLGASMPIPAEDAEGSYRTMDERITSFSWAKEILPGRALLAYATDEDEAVIMSVQYFTRPDSGAQSAQDFVWQVREVARFEARGPHKALDTMDPDYTPSGTAFSLKWSPWTSSGGLRIASLAVISENHVGFRKIAIRGGWEPGQEPSIEVEDSDSAGICLFLSTDAFVEWENTILDQGGSRVARGVIGTPFEVKPFQVDMSGPSKPPAMEHSTSDCSTTYPNHPLTNPITGLVIHRADPTSNDPAPPYSAVRVSATATNDDWYETNIPPTDQRPIPQWVQQIRRSTQRLVPRDEAVGDPSPSSESDTDDEFQEEAGKSSIRVHPWRFRFWGLASSPGDGSTVALVSKHSAQLPSRRGLSKLVFGTYPTTRQDAAEDQAPCLSTEGRMWEWMYGGGGQVPGATTAADNIDLNPLLRNFFTGAGAKQKCAFCDGKLQNDGTEARCPDNHTFATCSSSGLAILAPGVSRVCAICHRRCLKDSELRKLAAEYVGSEEPVPASGELCGGCGGKFTA